MEKKLHIISRPGSSTDYLFKGLQEELGINIVPYSGEPSNFIKKITRYLFVGRFPLPKTILKIWFDKQFIHSLSKIKATDRLLIIENTSPRVLGMINHLIPKETIKYNWFLNPMYATFKGKEPKNKLKKLEKQGGVKNLTFDIIDSQKFDVPFHPQFLRFPIHTLTNNINYDFYFVGQPKNREKTLLSLKELLEKKYSCLFIIPKKPGEGISYERNLELVEQSRCLIDIYQKKQSGLTRRALEALFYNKKLLTDNPYIKNYDFYHPNNIYIINEYTNIEEISLFLTKEIYIIPNEIKQKYDVRHWLKRFMP